MNDWQSTGLERRSWLWDLSEFEIKAFFTFSEPEQPVIEERRSPALKLALVLQIGFFRMYGREEKFIKQQYSQLYPPRVIDYWSLDTEGSELTILRSFPFDEYSFRVVTVEHNRFPVRDETRSFLDARGFRRARDMGIDDCFISLKDLPLRP